MQRRDTKKMTPGLDAGRMNKRKFESGVAYAGKTVGNKGKGKGGGVMLDDETIIELFFARSERAIGELAQKYGKLCHRLSHNIVHDWLEAEECVNDAYLAAWNAIPPARPAPLLPYIARIVRNLSLKAYWRKEAAKRSSRYTVALEELEDYIPDRKTVEEEVDARELVRIIEDFLDGLALENRVIFLRRYWFADSYKEIAGRVGLSEKNVSVRLTRIRKKMKQYLTERGVSL